MKVSLHTLKTLNKLYGCADDIALEGPEALAERIGAQLGAIEEVHDIGAAYRGIVIARIASCQKHPSADRLNVCLIDDGGVVQSVERDAQGYVQVVCGAPNVRQGMTVAWLPPGSTVPESYDKDPFVLGSRELRGVMSNGMLASPKELKIGDSHEGILEIDEPVQPGSDFAEYYGLAGDVIYDIENKMFTHRPDCFGFLGVAREVAGIQHMPFKSPDWYKADAPVPTPDQITLPFSITNHIPELVPRYTAIAMSGVTVKPSPVWLQLELVRAGLRPINTIVDLTNYFMLETGQPLHAYDYDKVAAASNGDVPAIVVRKPQAGESIALLSGKTIEPRSEAIMIATDNRLIAVGGIMGGADTEVDETTTNILIEVANFDMYSVRRTSMAHGLFTDAVSRFNKGQSPLQTRAVLAKMVADVVRLAGGAVASDLQDDIHVAAEVLERNAVHPAVRVDVPFINARLGLQLTVSEIEALLSNVECNVTVNGEELQVLAPFWRTDIQIAEDIVEEVGRLYGFDRLPLELPQRSLAPAQRNQAIDAKQQMRHLLSTAGANEVLTYSFVHGKMLERAGQDPKQAYSLSNALSPDLQYYRLSLTPSLLDKIHTNAKAGFGEFALFEIGKAHVLGKVDEQGLPKEFERLALVFAADKKQASHYQGAPYYQARWYLESLVSGFGIDSKLDYRPLDDGDVDSAAAYYQPGRAASIYAGDVLLGRIGEYKASVRQAFKLPEFCAGFEISTSALQQVERPVSRYQSLSRFPKTEQDICLRVAASLSYQELHDFVFDQIAGLRPQATQYRLTPVDIYQRPEDGDFKQVTLRLSIASYDKTLRDTEVSALLEAVANACATQFKAERV